MLPFHFRSIHSADHPALPVLSQFLAFSRYSFLFPAVVLFAFSGFWPTKKSFAGASASQWVVVVNAGSISSRTVANHFCALRNIPSSNVVVLESIPETDRITIDQFRELILSPILTQIEQRGLTNHIQGIAYSVDFPTSVDIASETQAVPNLSPYQTPVASLNGLTFFYRHVMSKSPGYLGFDSNFYASRAVGSTIRPSIESTEALQEYIAKLQAEEWKAAAEILESNTEKTPRELRSPNHLLAAVHWAKAEEDEKAIAAIQAAILTGWKHRDAIVNAPELEKLKQYSDYQRLLKLCPDLPFDYLPTRGFNARSYYAPNTMETKDKRFGIPFMLSTVLGVTRDLGISRFDVLSALKRSAKADFTPTKGAFLFTKSSDVRTTTRLPLFEMAIERLRKRGFDARIVEGVMPAVGEKCAGLMIGTPEFSVFTSGIEILPGAIAENLTSLGGAMRDPSQTKATEFLRAGAAISSGAVYEPYSIVNKFPHPMIHVAYTDGLTAAEAFYSSVQSPYQLLIVGDPLCQPYAKPPRFGLKNDPVDCTKDKPIAIELVVPEGSEEPETITLTLDGRFLNEVVFENKVSLQFSGLSIGNHELRILTKSSPPLQHCYEQSFPIRVRKSAASKESPNKSWSCAEKIQCSKSKVLEFQTVGLALDIPIEIWHDSEKVETITDTDTKSITIEPSKVGYGPVRLRMVQKIGEERIATNTQTILVEP